MANMGIFTSIASSFRAHNSCDGISIPTNSLRYDAMESDISRHCCDLDRNRKYADAKDCTRQAAALAPLVNSVLPINSLGLSERLIKKFGTIARVLSASEADLYDVIGNYQLSLILSSVKQLFSEAIRHEIQLEKIDTQDRKLFEFAIMIMFGETREHLHAIFLDEHSRFLSEERVATGDYMQIELPRRDLFRRAVALDSQKVILIHNHPSGRAQPSKVDLDFTKEVSRLGRSLGVELLDHLIVAGPSVFSMRSAGLM